MNSPVQRGVTPVKIVSSVLIFLMAAAMMLFVFQNASALTTSTQQGRHLLTIHDRETQSVILTDAPTIGEALKQAGIELDDKDAVEPARSEELVASDYQVNIYRARPVIVIDGMTKQRVITPYQTAEQIARSVGIKLYPEDETTLSRSDNILAEGAGLVLTINRATKFNFDLYGKVTEARTQAVTVADMLTSKNIQLGEADRVSPSLSTQVTEGMGIRVWREGKQTVTVSEPIDFNVEVIQDGDREVGYRSVKTPGVNGKRDVTYEVRVENGKEVSRREIASITISQPISQVELVGTKVILSKDYSGDRVAIMNAAGIVKSDQGYAAYIIDHENASWCPSRWQGQVGCPSTYLALYSEDANVGYGLCQATPGNKMATAGDDWRTNPVTQMRWCASYAISRYGSWQQAYQFKLFNGWW